MQDLDSKPGPIQLNICSMGGWVEGGMSMYDSIRSSKNKVITYACGAVYSAAVLPFEAGDIRVMQKSARLFVHDLSLDMGQVSLSTIKSVYSETEKIYDLYCSYLAERTGQTKECISILLKDETYLDAETCLKMGFCDMIVDHNNNKLSEAPKKTSKKKAKTK